VGKQKHPLAGRLIEAYGCSACKHQQIEDEFLCEHSRYWCGKQKRSFCAADGAHQDCQHWTFNGNDELIEQLNQAPLPGVVE
jgi:hypothetical protein